MKINNIYLGDCIQLLKEIEDKSIDAIVSDPPYRYLKHKLDQEFDEDIFVKECNRVVKDTGFVVLFGRGIPFYRLNTKLADNDFVFKEEIIWYKNMTSNPVLYLLRVHETICILGRVKSNINKCKIPYTEFRQYDLYKMEEDLNKICHSLDNPSKLNDLKQLIQHNKYEYNRNQHNKHYITIRTDLITVDRHVGLMKSLIDGNREQSVIKMTPDHYTMKHPTQKPVRLMERLIQLVSHETNIILDPFMGGGSTCIACKNINRNYIGFEINEEYFNLAKDNLEKHQDNLFYQGDNNEDTVEGEEAE